MKYFNFTITNLFDTASPALPLPLTAVVDLSVSVLVRLADHLVDVRLGQLVADVTHHVAQFGGADEAVPVGVEDAERLPDLLLRVRVLDLLRHHVEELREVDGAAAWRPTDEPSRTTAPSVKMSY